MKRTVSKINAEKASKYNSLGKTALGDISFGIDPATRFYELENSDKTEEG